EHRTNQPRHALRFNLGSASPIRHLLKRNIRASEFTHRRRRRAESVKQHAAPSVKYGRVHATTSGAISKAERCLLKSLPRCPPRLDLGQPPARRPIFPSRPSHKCPEFHPCPAAPSKHRHYPGHNQ